MGPTPTTEPPPHASTTTSGTAPPTPNPATEAKPDSPTTSRRNTHKCRDDTRFAQHGMATPGPTVGNPSPTNGCTIPGTPGRTSTEGGHLAGDSATRTASRRHSAFASSSPGAATAFAANAIT